MPLQFIQQLNPHTCLGFWKLGEAPDFLAAQLRAMAPPDLVFPVFPAVNRQQQWLTGRLLAYTLLRRFTAAPLLLDPDENGKPHYAGGRFTLSISHSGPYVAVILSDRYQVGIDIESIQPKVMRVRSKFLSEAEQTASQDDLLKTLIYWCTKETLYKLYGRRKLGLKEHIRVAPFLLSPTGELDAAIHMPDFQQDYRVHYILAADHVYTYCFKLKK